MTIIRIKKILAVSLRRAVLLIRNSGLACRGRGYHRDRLDWLAQCGRLALVYRPPQGLLHRAASRSISSTCRPPRGWCSSSPRARSTSSARSAWSSRSTPSRRARRSRCCASSARSPPYEMMAKPSIAVDQGPQGQDRLHRRPARHQPRLSRAHHARRNGFKDGDYDMSSSATRRQRFAALKSGAVDATMLAAAGQFLRRGRRASATSA